MQTSFSGHFKLRRSFEKKRLQHSCKSRLSQLNKLPEHHRQNGSGFYCQAIIHKTAVGIRTLAI
jgi:hypothetical protein